LYPWFWKCFYSWLNPRGNFNNILRAAFTCADPKSIRNTVKLSVFFALLGSACAKAASRMLMKLNPMCQCYKTFKSHFGHKDWQIFLIWLQTFHTLVLRSRKMNSVYNADKTRFSTPKVKCTFFTLFTYCWTFQMYFSQFFMKKSDICWGWNPCGLQSEAAVR